MYTSLSEERKGAGLLGQALLPLAALPPTKLAKPTTLTSIGQSYSRLGERQRALDYFGQALPLNRAGGRSSGEATTLNNIARVYDLLGEKQKALDYNGQALPRLQGHWRSDGEAMSLNNTGLVYDTLGEVKKHWLLRTSAPIIRGGR